MSSLILAEASWPKASETVGGRIFLVEKSSLSPFRDLVTRQVSEASSYLSSVLFLFLPSIWDSSAALESTSFGRQLEDFTWLLFSSILVTFFFWIFFSESLSFWLVFTEFSPLWDFKLLLRLRRPLMVVRSLYSSYFIPLNVGTILFVLTICPLRVLEAIDDCGEQGMLRVNERPSNVEVILSTLPLFCSI